MRQITTGRSLEVRGYIEKWYYNNRATSWPGIGTTKNKLGYMDFVGRIQGLSLGNVGFYGPAAQDKMFELFSYLFDGAVITVGKKKKLEGRVQLGPSVPFMIAHVLAKDKESVSKIAKKFKLPLK